MFSVPCVPYLVFRSSFRRFAVFLSLMRFITALATDNSRPPPRKEGDEYESLAKNVQAISVEAFCITGAGIL